MPTILASLYLASLLFPLPTAELPYEQIAGEFLADHGLENTAHDQVDLEAVLERDFFKAQVGLFEVLIPANALKEKETAADFKDISRALCEAQERWVDWLGEDAIQGAAITADLALTQKWIKSWKQAQLTAVAETDTRSAATLFEPKASQAEAIERAAAQMQARTALGLATETPTAIRLILMPERKTFVEFLAFAGWYKPELQSSFWISGIENWSEFRLDDLQVIALQYSAINTTDGDYSQFTSMKDRSATGLEQQVVQLGMNKLLAYEHGQSMPAGLISGLSVNMILEQYGECHTRIDGDTRSRVTQKREQFVPGGRSEGGMLPQNIAVSRWRADYGKYHFARILKQVQKSGASADKRNSDKLVSFLLTSDNGGERAIAHAPFLGSGESTNADLPTDTLPDFSELVRAYKSAFLYWLQTEAGGSKKKSAAAFASFLTKLSIAGEGGGFAKAIEDVYGMPLSDPELGPKCLERRFLKWISKQ